jgi:hypothetical protein
MGREEEHPDWKWLARASNVVTVIGVAPVIATVLAVLVLAVLVWLSGHVIAAIFVALIGWPAVEGALYWRAKRRQPGISEQPATQGQTSPATYVMQLPTEEPFGVTAWVPREEGDPIIVHTEPRPPTIHGFHLPPPKPERPGFVAGTSFTAAALSAIAVRLQRLVERLADEHVEDELRSEIAECDQAIAGWFGQGKLTEMRTTEAPLITVGDYVARQDPELWREAKRRIIWLTKEVQ